MKTAVILILVAMAGGGQEDSDLRSWAGPASAGQKVDIAPWTYEWRADRAIQERPEAYFIPRRLDRLDKVYRTAYDALPQQELKSIYYDMPDLLKPLLPQPKGKLQAGRLWTGGLVDYKVELRWPGDIQQIPAPEAVELRVYPTPFGWFGWTVDKILRDPEMSEDRRTWTYQSDPCEVMVSGYNLRVPAATEMVAVFCEGEKPVVPEIRITSADVGVWKRMDVEIEWGFQVGAEKKDFDGRIESHVAIAGPMAPLAGDGGTTMTGRHAWKSRPAGDARRGVVVPLLYASKRRPGLDSRITVWSETYSFTFSVKDLEKGPILIPAHGIFVSKAHSGQTARRFARELAAQNLKSIRQMTREHPEATSWDELMREARLWKCPQGTMVPPFMQVKDPVVEVQLSDERWTDMWRVATDQLRGRHMWGNLAHEVGRPLRVMEMVGLHAETLPLYDYFLQSPGVKSDGDFSDAKGSFEWAKGMRHDMGYNHEGTHASTGRILFAMSERYFLSGDKEWFQQHRTRLQAAADWIIRQRNTYMEDIPNRDDLFVVGLMPPCQINDYAMPACDWRWYYADNALSLQGLQRFADVLIEIDPKEGKKYLNEAQSFRKAIRRTVEREAALAPVRLGRDGTYRSYVARMAYAGGVTGLELGAPQFPNCDFFWGSLPLAETFAAIDAKDYRMFDTLDVMEELGTSVEAVQELVEARKGRAVPTEDAWFWHTYSRLPKLSHNANIYLLQDDVPGFLRFWMNVYANMVGANGKLWEHWHPDSYEECSHPDTMTAAWFIENFRNMLLMEDDQDLWLARGTPRVWLEHGKKIAVRNAPTYFGTLAYQIVSDVDNGRITATVEIPNRKPVKSLIVRFRHPHAAPIKAVTVNGKPWKKFDPDKEVIELSGLTGKAVVIASY